MSKLEKERIQKLREEVAQKRMQIEMRVSEILHAFNDDEIPEPTYSNKIDYTPLRYY